jgi:hypothetical protein
MICMFITIQDVYGCGTICGLIFVRLTWIKEIYKHGAFIKQVKRAQTYEL